MISETGELPNPDTFSFQPDGLIYFSSKGEAANIQRICSTRVTVSNRDLLPGESAVLTDDKAVGGLAAAHLMRRGFREFAYFGSDDYGFSKDRLQGFRDHLKKQGRHLKTCAGEDPGRIRTFLENLSPKTGIFAMNDIMARMVMAQIEQPTQRVPVHFAILGVDNDIVQRTLCPVPLSSIEPDGRTVGYRAMELVLKRIQNPDAPAEMIHIPPLGVKTRQSTEFFATEDALAMEALEMMDTHLADLGDVQDLIKRMNVPRRTLEYRFRKATGRTLARELAGLRIEHARDLLRNTSHSIEQIALEVGLKDARMLWLLFKRNTGETPSAYRKRLV